MEPTILRCLARAGLGIAFNAKPIVQRQAQASINQSDLRLILYFIGINGKDLNELNELVGGKRCSVLALKLIGDRMKWFKQELHPEAHEYLRDVFLITYVSRRSCKDSEFCE